jgi:hypothetical protein
VTEPKSDLAPVATEPKPDNAPTATAVTLVGLGLLAAYAVLSGYLGAGFAIPVGILGVCGGTAVVVMLGPVGKAIAGRISARTAATASDELDEIHARLQELEQSQARIAELEERVDFTERLLAQQKNPERLP